MKNFSIIAILLMFCIFTSCETEIPFNGTVTDPVLVVNCITCTDSIVKANITASRFFLTNQENFKNVDSVTVALFINGTFKENLIDSGLGDFKSQYVTVEGDLVRLNVSAKGFESVWTEAPLPSRAANFQIDTTITRTNTSYLFNVQYDPGSSSNIASDTLGVTYSDVHQFKICFSDPLETTNYYRLIVKETSTINGYTNVLYQTGIDDIVFGTKKNNMDGIFSESKNDKYNIFSDELINGNTHTITVYCSKPHDMYFDRPIPQELEMSVDIDLQSISRSYYLYLNSLKALDEADPFMSEPVQIYTNVNGGLGIMGARANQHRSYVLAE
jgi:hypothetical protein